MLVNLLAEMKRFGVTPLQIAKVTGRTERAVKSRLCGTVEITSDDLKKIREAFFPFYTLDYLLAENPISVNQPAHRSNESCRNGRWAA